MRVFVTGATELIGSAIVKELISAGHQVTRMLRRFSCIENGLSLGSSFRLVLITLDAVSDVLRVRQDH